MYIALYRKWRPNDFNNIVGQEHIVRALKNQVNTDRVAHAYLFSGPRGTGKTTTAKVFARAINCNDPHDGEPCGVCDACVAISAENNLDIIEIDAASNNGVDEIRELREKVKFPPTSCKYKVYIIDEVHMLSAGAFNALLKTLEEPPAHVVFILATTEQHKLPATILSRCQRYDFHRITTEVIADRLKMILDNSDVKIFDEAIMLIARSAEGGMRDALSIADMCLAYSDSADISYDDVARLIGSADKSSLYGLTDAIVVQNASTSLEMIDSISFAGRDMTVLARDLTEHFRNLMIYINCKSPEQVLDVSSEALEVYKRQTEKTGLGGIMYAMGILAEVEYQMKWSQRPRTLLEMAIIKICCPIRSENIEELSMKLERLENMMKSGAVVQKSENTEKHKSNETVEQKQKAGEIKASKKEVEEKAVETKTAETDPDKLWSQIKAKIKQKNSIFYMMIQDVSNARISDNRFVISFPEHMKPNYELAVKPDRLALITESARELGMDYPIDLKYGDMDLTQKIAPDEQIRLATELFGADNIIIKDGGK